jgi:CheY-like chemotaxis protein/DNA-directed RNA polymerase subunit RPC12/RpoP
MGPVHESSSYVLVVDDEPVVRDFLKRCLELWGYSVKQAATAAEAIEIMVSKPASVVLCDIKLPGQNGLWLTERLKAHWPQTPIVMATGIDDLETVRQSRELGAMDYLTKPFKTEQLRAVIERAVAAGPVESAETTEPPPESSSGLDAQGSPDKHPEAEYTLESPVKCPACGERIKSVNAVRLLRAQVNFTSTLPRRGRVIACPHCLAVIPAELTNF